MSLWRQALAPGAATRVSAAACLAAIGAAAIATGWIGGLLLCLFAVSAAVASILSDRYSTHIATFFVLLAIGDILKKATFLWLEQEPWSAYLPFLVPWAYFVAVILLPWLVDTRRFPLNRLEQRLLLFIFLALAMTWANFSASFGAKLAASLFLLLPWAMLGISARANDVLLPACRAVLILGVASAIYGLWQSAFGPTVIELRHAAETASFSIGAGQLQGALERPDEVFRYYWRITGFQPDAHTFAMFMMTSVLAAWIIRIRKGISRVTFAIVVGVLVVALVLSLVRTMWVSFLAFIVYGVLASRIDTLLRGRFVLLILAGAFLTALVLTNVLHDRFIALAGNIDNPIIARALTTGTLEARLGSFSALVEIASENVLLGVGFGEHPLVDTKFGENTTLAENTGAHNFVMEFILYFGITGFASYLVLMASVFAGGRAVEEYFSPHSPERQIAAVLTGYLVGMLLSGLGNGGVFLNFHFFFFAGALASFAYRPPPSVRLRRLSRGVQGLYSTSAIQPAVS